MPFGGSTFESKRALFFERSRRIVERYTDTIATIEMNVEAILRTNKRKEKSATKYTVFIIRGLLIANIPVRRNVDVTSLSRARRVLIRAGDAPGGDLDGKAELLSTAGRRPACKTRVSRTR